MATAPSAVSEPDPVPARPDFFDFEPVDPDPELLADLRLDPVEDAAPWCADFGFTALACDPEPDPELGAPLTEPAEPVVSA